MSEEFQDTLRPLLNVIGKLCVKETGFLDKEDTDFSVTFWVFLTSWTLRQ